MTHATEATFDVDVTEADLTAFAELSGDWNPLHTDSDYAATTTYGRRLLHGAYSAGLVSRMAGMHLPGRDCILHGMRLRFVAPIAPPARLRVKGRVTSDLGDAGSVSVSISDCDSSRLYTEAGYDFGRHRLRESVAAEAAASVRTASAGQDVVLVSGTGGALGGAVLARMAERGLALTRGMGGGLQIPEGLAPGSVSALVHCGWPAPDNVGLTRLDDPGAAVRHNVAGPLEGMIEAARILRTYGREGALLVLVGSTAARPGRHAWRSPLYSMAKTLVPQCAEILAVELAASRQRAVAVVFDALDGGMNGTLSPRARQAHADRSPWQYIPSPMDAAGQISWLLENASPLVSGAAITLSGGALP